VKNLKSPSSHIVQPTRWSSVQNGNSSHIVHGDVQNGRRKAGEINENRWLWLELQQLACSGGMQKGGDVELDFGGIIKVSLYTCSCWLYSSYCFHNIIIHGKREIS
jgi:hypothetical protein